MTSESGVTHEKGPEKSERNSTSIPPSGKEPEPSEKGEDSGNGGYAVCTRENAAVMRWFELTRTQRIFTFAGALEYSLQGIAIFAAIASGAGIALQNLIFGKFITTITDFVSGKSDSDTFLDEASELA